MSIFSIIFRVEGPDRGEWHVDLSPDAPNSCEGSDGHPGLVINMRKTDVFFMMLTQRLNLQNPVFHEHLTGTAN